MWTPLPLVAALAFAPAQAPAGSLNLTNVRTTYGELGGTRADAPLLPGDVLFVGFDIEGVSVDPEGRVVYTMAMEVADKAGKPVFKQDPAQKIDFVPLGGNKLPARAFITVGLDQPAGEYTLRVTVTDQGTKATKALEKKFTVLPKDFGIVAVYTSVDPDGRFVAPTTGIVGQSLYVQFGVVGFARDPAKRQPGVTVEMMPLDEAGKPTLQKPQVFNLDAGVDEKDPGFSVRFLIPLTRAGKFTVRLKATDRVANKTYTFNLPLAVVPSAN
jgi:hypothetical protein